jgi:hypothetical protein
LKQPTAVNHNQVVPISIQARVAKNSAGSDAVVVAVLDALFAVVRAQCVLDGPTLQHAEPVSDSGVALITLLTLPVYVAMLVYCTA